MSANAPQLSAVTKQPTQIGPVNRTGTDQQMKSKTLKSQENQQNIGILLIQTNKNTQKLTIYGVVDQSKGFEST
jgi:hypothetical protein